MPRTSAERVDIGRYARDAVANGWIVLLLVVALGGLAYVRAKSQHRVYASSAVVRVVDPSAAAVGGAVPPGRVDAVREVDNQVLYAQSPRVWAEVTRRLGADAARSVGSHGVLGSENSDTIRFTTQASDPASAQKATRTYVDVYLEQGRNTIAKRYGAQVAELRRQAADTQAQIDGVDAQLAALAPDDSTLDTRQNLNVQRQALAAKYSNLISIVGQAQLAMLARQQTTDVVQAAGKPGGPVSPSPVRDAALGCAVGSLIGLALVASAQSKPRHAVDIRRPGDAAPRAALRDVDPVPPSPVAPAEGCVRARHRRRSQRSARGVPGAPREPDPRRLGSPDPVVAGDQRPGRRRQDDDRGERRAEPRPSGGARRCGRLRPADAGLARTIRSRQRRRALHPPHLARHAVRRAATGAGARHDDLGAPRRTPAARIPPTCSSACTPRRPSAP